jgi:GDP-4-dehydro-6-deoxy-D-mannose reductase
MRPASPYAASKGAADLASFQYSRFPGLDIVRARPFNHIGPRQSPAFALAHFAQQITAIERGQRPRLIETGNLDARRDFTDVRDMVQAYQLLVRHGRTGVAYNIATGRVFSMQEVLDRLLALAGVQVEVRRRSDLVRSSDIEVLCGDASRLAQETGWTPTFSLDQTLTDILNYWRQRS